VQNDQKRQDGLLAQSTQGGGQVRTNAIKKALAYIPVRQDATVSATLGTMVKTVR
jgi:hypothetical protein